jgi:pimeloyl-[acyl-carrier protein] methyl ester esterase
VKLHAETRGRGPALVMLHGWGLDSAIWAPLLPELTRRFRVTCVDLPGHGCSEAGPDADLQGVAQSVASVAPPEADWLGWSLGGQIALAAALGEAEIRRLVLVATTPRFVAAPDWACGVRETILRGFADSLAADHLKTVRDFLTLQLRGDRRAATLLAELRRTLNQRGVPDAGTLRRGLGILAETDLRDQLRSVRQPALVISGERDRMTPAEAGRRLASGLTAARYVAFPGAAHMPFLSDPARFIAAVTGFLVEEAVEA